MKDFINFYNGTVHNREQSRPAIGITCYKCDKYFRFNSDITYELINIMVNNGRYDSYVIKNTRTGKISKSIRIATCFTVSITDWSEKIKAAVINGNGEIDYTELRYQLETCGIKTVLHALELFDKAKSGDNAAAFELFQYMFNTDMTGKMQNVLALGTSCKLNPNCKLNQKIDGSICQACYAENMRKTTAYKQALNTLVLCTYLFPVEQLPYLNVTQFRYESFADLLNDIQVRNYINLTEKNGHVDFGLWTKRPQFLHKALWRYYNGYKPLNLSVVASSLYINVVADYKGMFILADGSDMLNHVFTVFSADYALSHDIKIQCGYAICIVCKICYKTDTEFYINEVIKHEQKDYYEALGIDYKGRRKS